MAEVRIPTDQIPADILQRLQAILDGRPLMAPVGRGSAPSSRISTAWSSCVVSPTVSSPNMTVFADPSSSAHGKRSLQTTSSSSWTPPTYNSQPASARTARLETSQVTVADEVDGGSRDPFFSASSPSQRKFKDVLDDAGIVRVFPVTDDITNLEDKQSVDHSDSEIVRIFPEMDTVQSLVHESTIVRALTPTPSRSSLNIPRPDSSNVFGDNRQVSASSGEDHQGSASCDGDNRQVSASSGEGNRQSSASSGAENRQGSSSPGEDNRQGSASSGEDIRQSSTFSSGDNRQGSIFSSGDNRQGSSSSGGDNRHSSVTSGNDWNSRNETPPKSTLVSSSQGSTLQNFAETSPRRPASVSRILLSSSDLNNTATPSKGGTGCQVHTSPSYSPRLAQASEHDMGISKHLLTPPFILTARRSPGLPTPPQTPDDVDPDVDDDDVFTYNVPEHEYFLSRPQPRQACRKSSESSPRRTSENLRHHSDRSCELRHHSERNCETRHHTTRLLSPVGSAQNVSEQSFRDRHKTRKRLSFDDHMICQSPSPRPHHHSEPAPPILPSFTRLPVSNSNLSPAATSRPTQTGLCQSPSPVIFRNSHDSSPTASFYRVLSAEASTEGHPPTSIFHQPTPATASHLQNTSQSPAKDALTLVETAGYSKRPGQQLRSRLHSEGDNFFEGQFRGVSTPETSLSLHPRSQTFSHSKRRRTDVHDGEEQRQEASQAADQLQMTWSGDEGSPACRDCACSKIAQNFLQLVEGAYRRVGQVGGAQMGFDRFRQELALTNDILRESLVIVQQFKVMCRHEVTSSPCSPSTTSQR